MLASERRQTVPVQVGPVTLGGGAPVAVQSMTNTPTADVQATVKQVVELAAAGSELVRFTVNTDEAAAAVPDIVRRVRDAGVTAPLIGDFHYNGHALLAAHSGCAQALDKYRINPGNVGTGRTRDPHFAAICKIAVEHGKALRIGVNAGSLDKDLVAEEMRRNTEEAWAGPANKCWAAACSSRLFVRSMRRWRAGSGKTGSWFRARVRSRWTWWSCTGNWRGAPSNRSIWA